MSPVSGITTSDVSLINWQDKMKQFRTNFENLANALQSGDLSAAQKAFSALLQSMPSNNNPEDTIKNDFDALGKALQSGDLDAAKKAFLKLEQDLQTLRKMHHNSHNKKVEQSDTDTASNNNGTTSDNGVSTLA